MKVLNTLDSLDNIIDGETRKIITKTESGGDGNVVSSVSVSGDTISYTKGVTALTAHQNTFSNVKVGSTNIAADQAGDTLELVAGSNITLTPDATNDKVTIAATDTTYTDGTAGYTLKAKQDKNGNDIADTYVTKGTAQTITGNKTFSGNVILSDVKKATYTTSSTANLTPNVDSFVNPPWNKDLWHDHFAFLRYHTIESQESTTDGETWVEAEKDLSGLFNQKEATATEILSVSELAYRFVFKNTSFAYSGLSWFELSNGYTNPASQYTILIEHSADKTTWNTCHESSIPAGSSAPYYLRNGYNITTDGYLRFTFTKTTNLTTGKATLTCIKGLCTRKGAQGLGSEYEYPYDWDANANILPYTNNTKSLGSSSKKWANVYATTFNGNVTGNLTGTASKATGDKDGNQIDTTYLKKSGGTMTGELKFTSAKDLTWEGGSYQQRMHITDDAVANTDVFTFQQSTNSGSSWGDLLSIKDNGEVVATKFNGQLDGTVSSSTTGVTQNAGDNSTKIATTAYVDNAIITPLATQTYTDIIGNSDSNTQINNNFLFGSITPNSYTTTWEIKYRVRVWVPSNTNYEAWSEVFLTGAQGNVNAYAILNHFYSTSYRPVYYHSLYKLKQAGFTAGYGHAVGISLSDSTNRADTSLKRSFTVELISQKNCTMVLNDTVVKYGDWPGTGTTNYNDITTYNFSSNGLQETGDADTTYQLRSYYERPLVHTNKLYGYSLCTLTDDDKLTGFINSYTVDATKTKNTATFKIGAPIWYYGNSAEKAADSYTGDNTLYFEQNAVDFRYSSNCAKTLTANKPVYLVGTPTSPITYTLADTWWTQTLPSTADGKIYIYLGIAYNTYQIAWQINHPIYQYKDGSIQLYTMPISSNDITTALGNTPETINNKVTSLGSSSTDTQYPSAKCVYDLIGNVESILEALDVGGGVE